MKVLMAAVYRAVVALLIALFVAPLFGVRSAAAAQAPSSVVAGTVSVPAPDGSPFVVPGVTLTLTCGSSEPKVEVSNERGEFRFVGAPLGSCAIAAELQGFKTATTTVAVNAGETSTTTILLGLETLHEEVTVRAQTDLPGSDTIEAHVERMTTQTMETAPIASERFQDALPLIPGVVRGPDGLLNINGTRSNQSALTFNNANGTDPVTGEDAIELPIDAVSTVQVRGAAFAPEFGLSAGAVTTVETQRAGDAWHVTLNDLEPRPRRRAGEFRGIESWTPRLTTGGPLIKGKLSVLESTQYEYSQTRVFGLPAFQSDTELQSFESYTRADWSVSEPQHLTASAMISPRKTTYAGLNTFNPQPVTPNIRNNSVLASATDQIVVGQSGVLDTLVSVKQFDATIYPSRGSGPMILAPDVNTGSYFNDQDRTSRRAEWLTTYGFTPFGPAHLVKVGAGLTYETFNGTSTSRPVDIVRENGTLSEQIGFIGSGRLSRSMWGTQGYAQDSWTVSPRLSATYGVRFDRDSFTSDINVAPRGSFAVTATADGRTVVRGGAGVFYDPIPLNVASFDQLQERTVTDFAADGLTPVGPTQFVPNVVTSAIHTPRSINWNVEVDREWIRNLFVRVGYQQRENRFESVLDPVTLAGGDEA
ncbi:MAG TPA: carboxypeptidase regulatory-like domain-containing protein, partial [Vicinamibacterales bacterium]|nr:carboxypeptidase regulatory-like domain-containing protein [Vicinamibacterales bacterium]